MQSLKVDEDPSILTAPPWLLAKVPFRMNLQFEKPGEALLNETAPPPFEVGFWFSVKLESWTEPVVLFHRMAPPPKPAELFE